MRMLNTPHPGSFIRTEIIEPPPVGDRRGAGAESVAARAFEPPQWQSRPVGPDGASYRKGLRRQHGNADARTNPRFPFEFRRLEGIAHANACLLL